MSIVIIGNGIAALSCAESIRRKSSDTIIMVSKENVMGYYRPFLSGYLGKSSLEKHFYVKNENWYSENNVDLKLGRKVLSINVDKKTLDLDDGDEISYTKLILANGSHNVLPPIPNINLSNVFTLRTLSDAENIKNEMKISKNALIIGGGLLGLEAAWAMKTAGLDVTVVEMFPRILPKQLDDGASKIFTNVINKAGINLITSEAVEKVLGDKKAEGILLKSRKEIKCDLILVSIGIIPNINLAANTGINVSKGIVVNSKMETNIENIYACGDIAEYNGRVYGNWPSSMTMGRTAGLSVCGLPGEFKESVPSSSFEGMNTSLFSAGNVTFGPFDEIIDKSDESRGITKRLFIKDGILVGAILMGDIKESTKLTNAIKKGFSRDEIKAAF